MRTLVIGRGQLGRAIERRAGGASAAVAGIPWNEPTGARRHIDASIRAFLDESVGQDWLICWSAGVGVIGADATSLAAERQHLAAALDTIAAHRGDPASGRLFLASSAGGIYAASPGIEADERSTPAPQSAYGESKLAQDDATRSWAAATGVATMIGRISNLYSSEQNLQKPQGFISHLCRAVAHRRPFTLTVPSHTIRDFVHTDDVAARILTWAQGRDHAPETIIKVLAAGRSVTLGRVIGMVHAIGSRSPQVAFAVRPSSSMQPTLLRFRSVVRSDLEAAVPGRTLEEGIASVWTEALRSRHRAAW